MGKKKNHNHGNVDGEKEVQKEAGDGGDKKKEAKSPPSVVLKIEMHCEGCASKIIKLARRFDGVESVKAESESNKLTVIGKVDPSKIRDFLHQKTKKKVDLISPQPKKEDSNNTKNDAKKPNDNNKKSDADDKKKPKEAPVTTAVIKVAFHCNGCSDKIHKIVAKTPGVHEMTVDKQKETVTVKGTMDVKALTETLKEKLKRPVEIVPPKKDKDGEKDGDNAGGGGGKKKKGGGGEGQDNAAAGGGDVGAAKMEGNRMEYVMQPGFGFGFGAQPGYGYNIGQPQPAYGNGYMGQPVIMYGNGYMGMATPVPVYDYGYGYGQGQVPGYPVHMKFNDENPNACSVM